ncbi:predicted protein [Sclerotinia sclerotiorum 1980 UF-70]|uniref:Uncharacterized protein n=1 Tax=Sclerotinia sclerotiorum (strain ATCC 18683 / 1980 / Ss-1) TaxID=665079 RepID=A7ESC1_SCLS1|nr:predicted protein [Sclerotinia sclerotiorum 1980 UF-70]EDN92363.1 predicted protein [Sclerotinia sclerotiorum 1980 UF-70]
MTFTELMMIPSVQSEETRDALSTLFSQLLDRFSYTQRKWSHSD